MVPGRVGSSPDKAGTCQHCQMVRVRRAGRKGVREEPAFTSLNACTGSNLADMGRGGAHPPSVAVGNSWVGIGRSAREATAKCLRGSRGDAAGAESGSSSVERITVNMGTVLRSRRPSAHPACRVRLGAPSADRAGTGRSRRSTPSRGEPGTWGRTAAVSRREGGCNAERCAGEHRRPGSATLKGRRCRVSGMQTKLHRWAAADPGRRFDDLFNFVHDPATLIVAFDRVAGNTGANTAGVDGLTVADVEASIGMSGFLDDLRDSVEGRLVSSVAGAGTQDPEAGR